MLLQRNADPGPFPAPKQKFCRPHHKALSLLYDIQGPASSFNFFLLTAAQNTHAKQCGGRPYGRPPQRDPIFRDAKVLLFWCDQQQKEYGSIPLCRHIGWVFYPSVQVVSGTRPPLISSPGMVPRGVISNVRITPLQAYASTLVVSISTTTSTYQAEELPSVTF